MGVCPNGPFGPFGPFGPLGPFDPFVPYWLMGTQPYRLLVFITLTFLKKKITHSSTLQYSTVQHSTVQHSTWVQFPSGLCWESSWMLNVKGVKDEKTTLHTQHRTHVPPWHFLYLIETHKCHLYSLKLEVWRRRWWKSPFEDPCSARGVGKKSTWRHAFCSRGDCG